MHCHHASVVQKQLPLPFPISVRGPPNCSSTSDTIQCEEQSSDRGIDYIQEVIAARHMNKIVYLLVRLSDVGRCKSSTFII